MGPELEKWALNEELLCDRIPYFKAAFKTGFKESKEKKLELPEDNPEAFGQLVDWLYMESVLCPVCDDYDNSPSTEDMENPKHVLQWAQLWVLADKLGCEKLMDLAEEKFIKCVKNDDFVVTPGVISFVFEQTSETCYLREWLPEYFMVLFFTPRSYSLGEAAAASENFNVEFLKQIKAHVDKKKEDCYIYGCTLHKAGDKRS